MSKLSETSSCPHQKLLIWKSDKTLLSKISKKSLYCGMNIACSSNQCSDIFLSIKETHILQLC